MNAPTVKELYAEVTESLLKAEKLEDFGDVSEAATEQVLVSMLEEQLAERLPAADEEGAIARRGAVSAALSAGMPERALDLAARYLDEGGSDEHLQMLRELEDSARASAAPSSDPQVLPGARFRFRDHAV